MRNATDLVDEFVHGICLHDEYHNNSKLSCRECLIDFVEKITYDAYMEGKKNATIREVEVNNGYGCPLCGRLLCNGRCFK